VKFYRLILIISASLTAAAALSHLVADQRLLAFLDLAVVGLILVVYLLLRYPKRIIFRSSAAALAVAYVIVVLFAYQTSIRTTSLGWAIAGAITSTAILGSVNLAMLLGHWYLVVRGMSIDPLIRLTKALLVCSVAKLLCVGLVLMSVGGGFEYGDPLHRIMIANGIFFWMRVGWGLAGPLGLYPMIWGTVKIRSTMAATGILYVAVVAVVIGEVLGLYLSALLNLAL